jgi:abortive infection bacteriophage resistance protein
MRYQKPALTYEEQYDLIVSRGLVVEDRLRLIRWLKHISYYRLSAYFIPFKIGDQFNQGATFDQVAGVYIFDRKLRLILLDAVERIEVALRTDLTYEITHAYGPFGHTDPKNFDPAFDHEEFMNEVREAESDSRETFISHYRTKYTKEEHLPLWMASELLSFGCISKLYRACAPAIKRKIAGRFSVQDAQLASWFHALSYIRNVCAHHSRLWNRTLAVKPSIPNPSRGWPYQIPRSDRLYAILVIVRHCLLKISPSCHWRERMFAHFDRHPDIDLAAMGIPPNWRQLMPWTDPIQP